MGRCPFYNVCKKTKNPGICEDSNQLLLCRTHNKLIKERGIINRANQIMKLKKGEKIRL